MPLTTVGRRLSVLPLVVLVLCLTGLAHADEDEGTVQVQAQPVGPYRVTVLSTPAQLTVGKAVITVVVTDAAGYGVADVNVDVEAVSPGQKTSQHALATHDNAVNEVLYAAFMELPTPGRWSFGVHIVGAAGSGDVSFGLVIGMPRPYHFTQDASQASVRVRLTPNGSTPALVVTDDEQAHVLLSAGALGAGAGAQPERVQVIVRPDVAPSPPGLVVQGNVYHIEALSLADGQPVAEPWSAPVELTLRLPAGGAATGLFRLEQDGSARLQPGSVVSDPCICVGGTIARATIERGGWYLVGDPGSLP